MSSKGYNVYKVKYRLGLQDPAFTETRYHTVILVETTADGEGYIHEVNGDIASADGMIYQSKREDPPEQSETFHNKTYLGWVCALDYPAAVEDLLRSLPRPPRQRWFNPNTMAWEQCKPDGTLYGPHETRPTYWKCTEWTEQRAIPALQKRGLLHVDGTWE